MLTPVKPKFHRRGRPLKKAPATTTPPTPPAGLVLVSAEYNHDEARVLILSFDRPIDIDRLVGSQVIVEDGDDSGLKFAGTGGATLDDPNTVRIGLNATGDATVPGTVLTAVAGAGITAAEDAGVWAGVTDLGLPFP